MRLIRYIMLIAFMLPTAVFAQPAAPAPIASFRQRMTAGDLDRNWTNITCADGQLSPTWTVGGQSYTRWQVPSVNSSYDLGFHGGFAVTDSTPQGILTLNVGRPLVLEVVTNPVRRTLVLPLPVTTTASTVQLYVNAGYNDITLAPGLHQWDRLVNLPAYVKLSGYGATVKRIPGNPYGGNSPLLYISGRDVSIYGITFINDMPLGVVVQANPSQPGLVIADCTFNRCQLGFYFTQALIRDCTFNKGGAVIAPAGLFWRCVFNGPSITDPWQFWYMGNGITTQMIDCVFNKTQRGPVFNALGNSVDDSFFSGVQCHGIVRDNNDCECWLCEGGRVNRLMAFHCRVTGCDSSTFQFDGGSADCYVRDFAQDGGFGLNVSPTPGCTTTNFVMQDFELRRCGIYCGANATTCSFVDGSIIGYAPTRGNQGWQNTTPVGFLRTIAAWSEGPNAQTNSFTRVRPAQLSAGLVGIQGFLIKE